MQKLNKEQIKTVSGGTSAICMGLRNECSPGEKFCGGIPT